ncbi:MAG: hypothetical protein LBO09_09445 [Candidatus Peribacteria bacterium]|nr:hypothetical protein [Candidatus Peribacteria bacterium]
MLVLVISAFSIFFFKDSQEEIVLHDTIEIAEESPVEELPAEELFVED